MNLQPSGYEPDELPGCSTPRYFSVPYYYIRINLNCQPLFLKIVRQDFLFLEAGKIFVFWGGFVDIDF